MLQRKRPDIRHSWRMGETVDRAEAIRRVSAAYRIPPYDPALAEARITLLVQAGWLRPAAGGGFTLTEPPAPSTTKQYQVTRWTPQHSARRVHRVTDDSGNVVEVATEVLVPERTEVHSTTTIPA